MYKVKWPNSMIANLKALIPMPIQKKARRGSKQVLGELPVLSRGTPWGTLERHRRGSTKDMKPPKNPKEATLEDLLRIKKEKKDKS